MSGIGIGISPAFGSALGIAAGGVPWALPGAGLDMDFQLDRAYAGGVETTASSLVSCTRAGNGALAQKLDNSWVSFLANTLRRTDKGLLGERAATNSIRNNSGTGGSAGVLPTNWSDFVGGGLTLSKLGEFTVNGLPVTRFRLFGTASSTSGAGIWFDTSTGIAAATAQAWTLSPYLDIVSGSVAGLDVFRVVLTENTSGGVTVKDNFGPDLKASLTATQTNFPYTVTLSGGGTVAAAYPHIDIGYTSGAVIDITFDVMPQLELGAFATSPILTTTVAVTRASDLPTVIGVGATIIPLSAAAFFQFTGVEGIGTTPRLISLGSAFLGITSTQVAVNDAVNAALAVPGSGTIFGTVKAAFGLDNASIAAIANGGTQVTNLTSAWATNVAGQTPILGNNSGAARALNGYIQRAAFGATKGMFDALTT